MIVQRSELVCQLVYFVYQILMYKVRGGGAPLPKDNFILMAFTEFCRSEVTNVKLALRGIPTNMCDVNCDDSLMSVGILSFTLVFGKVHMDIALCDRCWNSKGSW